MHLYIFCQSRVSDDFKNVLNDYFHKNCRNFPDSMFTSGLPNGCPKAFLERFYGCCL